MKDGPKIRRSPYGIRMLKQSVTRQADSGVAVIISSHLLAMVEDICSDILILDEGCNKFYGTLEQLKLRFGDASFTGESDSPERSLEEIYFSALN